MKKSIKALWHGVKAVFTAVVGWVATLFGMNDNTKYSRVLQRIIGTAFAVVVILWVVRGVVRLCDYICWDECDLFDKDDGYYLSEELTDDLFYYDGHYDKVGYLANADGKKIIKNVYWIAKPMKGDSLVCFSDGEYRGYFHLRDGHIVVKPIYDHAWIFSDGLAAVKQEGRIMFIDTTGNVVINKGFAYDYEDDGYVFHQGHCAVNDITSKHMGLIDRNGEWVIEPRYKSISPIDTFWIVRNDDEQAILTFGMDTVIPMIKASFEISDTTILATFADHTMSTYSLQGNLITASQIQEVEQLMYETREVVYPTIHGDNEEYSSDEPYCRKAVATCLRYEAEWGWYGLLSPDGHILTPPCYVSIEAVDKDLYLCETIYDRGVLLNSKGVPVQ